MYLGFVLIRCGEASTRGDDHQEGRRVPYCYLGTGGMAHHVGLHGETPRLVRRQET